MNTELAGKRALVTGAVSGMGRAIALAFAREGAVLAVHARGLESATALADEIRNSGASAMAVSGDLTDNGAIRGLCEKTIVELGGVDIVVNNAGAISKAPLSETSEED